MSKTIELIKSEIYEAKSNLLKFNQLLIENPKKENYSFYVTYFTNRLNILEQIKCELEAWEVVKKHFEVDYWNGIPESITMTSNIYRKDFPIIKKALEVERDE